MTDWFRFRKCPVCHAAIGNPCVDLLGRYSLEGKVVAVEVEADQPHRSRKPRTEVKR